MPFEWAEKPSLAGDEHGVWELAVGINWRSRRGDARGEGPNLVYSAVFKDRQCSLSQACEREGPVDGVREGTGPVEVCP